MGQGVVSYGPPPEAAQAIVTVRQSVLASLKSLQISENPEDHCF